MNMDEDFYAPPKADIQAKGPYLDMAADAWRDRKLLVVRKGAELPDRCLKCDAPAEGNRFSRDLSWHRPFWLILVILSLWLYLIVYFFIRWKGRVTAGLCPLHRRRRVRAIALGWLATIAGVAVIVASFNLSESRRDLAPYPAFGMLGGLMLLLGGVIGGLVGSQVLVPRKMDEHFIWLDKVAPEYLARLPDWNAPGDLA